MRIESFHRRFLHMLVPGILQAGAGILVLPLATRILTPEDYGVFALVTGVTVTATAIAGLGSSFILGNRFDTRAKHSDNIRIVSTMMWLVLFTGLVLSVIVVIGFMVGRQYSSLMSDIPSIGVLLAVVDLVASSLWGVATSVAVFSRMTRQYALFASARALINPLVLLCALFLLNIHGPIALFAGIGAAGVVTLLGSWRVTKPYLHMRFDRLLAAEAVRSGGWLALANFAEAIERLVERWVLAFFVSVRATGLLAHAQIYPSLLMLGIRPALQSAWPTLRVEALQEEPSFPKGRCLVYLIGLLFGAAAIVMALVGSELIGLLTNDRFVDAAPYAAMLVAIAGLRIAGRPQHAVIVANGHAATAAMVNGLSALCGIVFVVALVPFWGLSGAVAALAGYGLAFLTLMHLLVRRIRIVPMLDAAALAGFLLTLVVIWGVVNFDPSAMLRFALASLVTITALVLAWKMIRRSGIQLQLMTG